ncbi:hypothetical protein PP175_29600 (plasmid) [Aneurinibacillus sp. Ricciae_BoGa-3]|uniref:hypothetical protein n=1 Tax=Aneurinibacillus sp. Ricciae_BoGa-3 TaxID=3022697 RepID=UPI0023416F8C|nr:hypothetical protein [Aneurinibacillus sp. Ricciae_BoGa-3]WCK57348.1 hypothetical protein PP175_29600 [Aneurinibacillus sp. Ricciae_BoGa-3]
MSNYFFEPKTTTMIRAIRTAYANEEQYKIDDRILLNHNEVCLCCQTPFKQSNTQIKGVGAVVAYRNKAIKTTPHTVMPYAVCKKCSKELQNHMEEFERKTTKYIAEIIPDLKAIFDVKEEN